MKVLNSSQISPFGGLNFVHEEFDRLKIEELLNEELPALAMQSKYSWRDILYSFWSIYFCGGDCIEDLAHNLQTSFIQSPFLKTPSPDRVLNRLKELAVPSQQFDTPKGRRKHTFNINNSLNRLNLKLIKDKVINTEQPIVLDYDNTLIFAEKADATRTYLKQLGYAPGVGIIGNRVAYVENRNGHSDAQTLQHDTLSRMFTLLNSEGIKPDVFRGDGASYSSKTIETIDENVSKFYVRGRMSGPVGLAINQIKDWKAIQIDDQPAYRGSIRFKPFEALSKRAGIEYSVKEYRLVITKQLRADRQLNVFTGEAYNYHPIITNDFEMSDDEVVFFYNQRGAIEKEFDVLKNDFGWNNMPFSRLEQNNVYLILTAMCRNLYAHIIEAFSTRFKGLSEKFRIKKFTFRFISVPAKWIRTARQWKLKVYHPLAFKT